MNGFQLKDKKILILGLGKTGFSVAKALSEFGHNIVISDTDDSDDKVNMANELKQFGIRTIFNSQSPELLKDIQLLIPSPGIPNANTVISSAIEKGLEVISEIELAFCLNPSMRIIGVTGTNGKTSVTTMVANILKTQGLETVLAGNIGIPLIDFAVKEPWKPDRIYVVELSSFQLQNTKHFKPWIGCILNIDEDHLDWHENLKNYAGAKWRIFSNQTQGDYAVINQDDNIIKETMPALNSRIVTFSLTDKGTDFYYKDGKIVSRFATYFIDNNMLIGLHNIQNMLASAAIAALAGASSQAIEATLNSFEGLEHRIKKIATIRHVDYYDDSKATNPHATISAIGAFKGKQLILLMGGKNKGNSFKDLARMATGNAREILLFGESADEIAACFSERSKVHVYKKMVDAVRAAKEIVVEGDIVLLSPACASFDEFTDYKHRGKIFKEVVYDEDKALQYF